MKEVGKASFQTVYYWTGIDYRNKLLNKSTLWTFCLNRGNMYLLRNYIFAKCDYCRTIFCDMAKKFRCSKKNFYPINSIFVHSIIRFRKTYFLVYSCTACIIRFRKTCFLCDLVRKRLILEHFCHEYHNLVRGSVWNSSRFKLVVKNLQRNFVKSTITLSNKRVSYVNIVNQHSKTCRRCHQSEWNIKQKRNETD